MLKGVVVILKELKIPEATVSRLSVYSRYLTEVAKQEIVSISSGEIAEGVGGTPAQVRKDLAYFGEFGTRGPIVFIISVFFQIINTIAQFFTNLFFDRFHLG